MGYSAGFYLECTIFAACEKDVSSIFMREVFRRVIGRGFVYYESAVLEI